jgi:feruloyl-CoA synthase
MSRTISWITPEVKVTDQQGDLILQNTVVLDPAPPNIGVLLRRNVEQFPDKPFILQRNATGAWHGPTYAEALARVNRLSNGLLAQRLDGSRPVAILSENSVDMALLQLAAMQIGIPVVPISYAYSVASQTGSHIKHILDLTRPSLLVMSDATVHMSKLRRWDTSGLQLYACSHSEQHEGVRSLVDLELGSGELTAEGQARFAAVTPQTLAKLQFTSGSTNPPKGVEVTHGMLLSNQTGIAQMWPFVGAHEVVVDWLPWNHTFGGNFVFNMILMHGGTFYIDRGNPTPQGLETTITNILEVSPTIYFGVPRSYTALYARMQTDVALREAFFRRLKCMFTAAAALDQLTFDSMQALSAEVRGERVPFLSAWGATETTPDATLVYWPTDDARVIGLPIPGVSIKLAQDPSGKRELRVKGPNVTRGYYHNPEATAAAFDDDGYYRTGDAGAFLDPANPMAGLVFDGRLGEDFKLNSGTWVHNARLRASINQRGQPFLLEVVVAAPNQEYLAALIFPNVTALRARFPEASERHADDATFLQCQDVRRFFAAIFEQHNREHPGSSERFQRCTLLPTPPRLDHNETTDKGYINQVAVLTHRADVVAKLYEEPSGDAVIVLP